MSHRGYTRPLFVVLGAGAVLAMLILGLSSQSGYHASGLPAPNQLTPAPTVARWWSSPAGAAGTPIDLVHPEAAARRLRQNTADYCSMLASSLSANPSLFTAPPLPSGDVQVATRAWLAELEALAPKQQHDSWRVIGNAMLIQLQPRHPVLEQTTSLLDAVAAVSRQARSDCGIQLSNAGPG